MIFKDVIKLIRDIARRNSNPSSMYTLVKRYYYFAIKAIRKLRFKSALRYIKRAKYYAKRMAK